MNSERDYILSAAAALNDAPAERPTPHLKRKKDLTGKPADGKKVADGVGETDAAKGE